MLSLPKHLVVGYQGTDGAYSKVAAERHFAHRCEKLECIGFHSFSDLLNAVLKGDIAFAMQPIENTTAGSINEAYDLLAQLDLHLVGEEVLKVEHCLAALPGVRLDEIRRVYSHPQALAQSSHFLAKLEHAEALVYTDTAMAMKKVRDDGIREQAAVAGEHAAAIYGLQVLARDIANQSNNYTRFVVAAKAAAEFARDVTCKTSLIITTKHEQGALVKCLGVLADHGLSLTKIESRPKPNTPWEYIFYLDFDGNLSDPNVAKAVEGLRANTVSLRVLGSYPSRTRA